MESVSFGKLVFFLFIYQIILLIYSIFITNLYIYIFQATTRKPEHSSSVHHFVEGGSEIA